MTNGFWLGRVFGLHGNWIKDRKNWKLKWKM